MDAVWEVKIDQTLTGEKVRVFRESRFHRWGRMSAKGRFETFPWLAARSPICGLAQVPPADLDIPILGQLAPSDLHNRMPVVLGPETWPGVARGGACGCAPAQGPPHALPGGRDDLLAGQHARRQRQEQ
jgi:hypothetical protein